MILVADASFAAKVVLDEHGTDVAQQWWMDTSVNWVSPALVVAEVEAAIHAHHRAHPERFDRDRREHASTVWRDVVTDMAIHVVDVGLVDGAVAAIQQYGPLRGADAVYVAVALALRNAAGDEVVLGSFDQQQRRAALVAGLVLAP